MKKKILTSVLIAFCFVAIGMSSVAQSSVYYYLRDSSPNYPNPPHHFTAYIAVWDNSTSSQIGTTQGPFTQYTDQDNYVYTTVTVPDDGDPRWRIIIQVNEYDDSWALLATQYRQTGLLTTTEYEAGGIQLSGITF